MERELPVFTIEGTDFIVDIQKGGLVQADDPGNIIELESLSDHGTHYEMFYDLREKNWVAGVGPIDDQMVDVKIPLMVTLDPVGMAEKYGVKVAGLQGKTDKQIMAASLLPKLREQKHTHGKRI